MVHQINFTANWKLVFVLTQGNAYLQRFHFKAYTTEKTQNTDYTKKMVLAIFKVAIRLRFWHIFMWQSREILKVFITLTLKQVFWKTKPFIKKTGVLFFTGA